MEVNISSSIIVTKNDTILPTNSTTTVLHGQIHPQVKLSDILIKTQQFPHNAEGSTEKLGTNKAIGFFCEQDKISKIYGLYQLIYRRTGSAIT